MGGSGPRKTHRIYAPVWMNLNEYFIHQHRYTTKNSKNSKEQNCVDWTERLKEHLQVSWKKWKSSKTVFGYYVRWQRGTARIRASPAALLCAVQQSIDMSCGRVQCSLYFFQCARKSIVFERHIFMPEHLNFFIDVMSPKTTTKSLLFETVCCIVLHAVPAYCLSFDTRLISLDRHQVSTLQTKVRSPAAWFPSNGHHAVTLKITARQLETAARRFFVTCAAAQLRGNIGRVAAAKFADRRTDGRTDAVSFHRPCYAYYTVCGQYQWEITCCLSNSTNSNDLQ